MTLDMMMLLDTTWKILQSIEEITDKLDIIKIKNLNSAKKKTNVKEMRKQAQTGRRYLQ